MDKDLKSIMTILESDPNYESNYNNRKFYISPVDRIHRFVYAFWLPRAEEAMSGNGFLFGSKTTQKSANVKKIAYLNIAFDHKSIGFDSNNSEQCTGYISNCASFNNNINYQLPYKFAKWKTTGV